MEDLAQPTRKPNRHERRAAKKVMGEEAQSSIDLMLTLEKCKICEAIFDRKSKEQANTWFIQVYKEQKRVDLYCPECFNKKEEQSK